MGRERNEFCMIAESWHTVFSWIVDAGSDHIGGKQIRCKLNPRKIPVERLGQRLDRKRLGEAGQTFQQDVSIGKHRGNQPVDQNILTCNNAAHLGLQRTDKRRGLYDISLKFL